MFDSASVAQVTRVYVSALQSQQGLQLFESASDDNTTSSLNAIDISSSITSAELSDSGHCSRGMPWATWPLQRPAYS